MTSTERVTIRLTPELVDAIDAIAIQEDLRFRSKVIRAAIEYFIAEKREEHHARKVIIHVPERLLVQLDELVQDGEALSREDAINTAIRDFIRKSYDYLLREREAIRKAREEMRRELPIVKQ
jgi:metal-responsive CopG/Arc/MetJ family transcriptional regulator